MFNMEQHLLIWAECLVKVDKALEEASEHRDLVMKHVKQS